MKLKKRHRAHSVLILTLVFMSLISRVYSLHSLYAPSHPFKLKPIRSGPIATFDSDEEANEEFAAYCEKIMLERQESSLDLEIHAAECDLDITQPFEFDIEIDAKMLFTLIVIITWGAIVRAVIHAFHLQVPYTVVLMISGLIVGIFSKQYCSKLHEYTAIARISSKLILFTFLPLLIFESAFSIPVHTFTRSTTQICLVAFPGMVFCTFLCGLACMKYFQEYKWNFLEASLFGSIISATDPVAVVAILRELGVSEVLSVMIEGESLLNDGVAILLYEIFEGILVDHEGDTSAGQMVLAVFLKFVHIAIGGPIFGWIMGKITIFCFQYVFNDPPVEISATIVTAYLTYWLSEDVLHVSGVMAVVLLGLTLRAERTVISPDSEGAVHHFWSILGYLANTVLFTLVGIVITETALNEIKLDDYWNLIFLYVFIHVSRFMMLVLFYPILAKLGYGITWQNMIIMLWGGLRGAVGICLALEVFRSEEFCEDRLRMGSKMLFLTAGIVFLTLCVNGTTTRALLSALKLTEITVGRMEDMTNAVKRVRQIKGQSVRMFKLSQKMFDADWSLVNEFCTVRNPYKIENIMKIEEDDQANNINSPKPILENSTVCTNCHAVVPNEPTSEEYFHLTEESRLKVIRAMKVSFTHRNGIGLTSDSALQILMNVAERAEDKELKLIRVSNFEKHTKIEGFYPWLDTKITKAEHERAKKPAKPGATWRHPFYAIATNDWFERIMMGVIVVNIALTIWELIDPQCGLQHDIFEITNTLFTAAFVVEFIMNIIGRTSRDFFCDVWSYLDLLVLVLSLVDCVQDYFYECKDRLAYVRLILLLRLLRISRALRLLRPILPQLQVKLQHKIHHKLFIGFDILRGFVFALEEVLKFLPQIIENKKVHKVIKDELEKERSTAFHLLNELQHKYPRTSCAIKTRNAARAIINSMCYSLQQAEDEGLLDDTEVSVLTRILELKIKRLWHSPTSIEPEKRQSALDIEKLH